MPIFRSEEMDLCQLFLQSEATYACISELGEIGEVQFNDLNPGVNAYQRKYVNEVRRCEEMERKLRYMEKEIVKEEIKMSPQESADAPPPREMIDLEATFEKLETELREVTDNYEALQKNFLELTELKFVLEKSKIFFEEREIPGNRSRSPSLVPAEELGQHLTEGNLNSVAGVLTRERAAAFELMLWRICRGNILLRQTEIEEPLYDPVTGDLLRKCVFVAFFQGDLLKTKVRKICEGFRTKLYPCPENAAERLEMINGVRTRIDDMKLVLNQTKDHRNRLLSATARHIKTWLMKARKIKAIYHILNLFNFDVTRECLVAECWVPTGEQEMVNAALRRGMAVSGSTVQPILNVVHTSSDPPTYFKTNKFTQGFQNLVDAYGVANYREMNPAPYTCITFPFLFAVMFGDAGHGTIMLLFALYMILRERHIISLGITDEVLNIFFGGRYIILMMGIFSIYTGFIYNDIFSKSANIFGSAWQVENSTYIWELEEMTLDPNTSDYRKTPYPVGLDPMWQLAINKIAFQNAFKMKISIIIGVSQMLFGLCLSFVNYKHFKAWIDIFTCFIPQVLFLLCLFWYLCFLIILKWWKYSADADDFTLTPGCAPQILILFINMFLMQATEASDNCDAYLYNGERIVETILIFIIVITLPWMLLVKPIYLYIENKRMPTKCIVDGYTNSVLDPELADEDDAIPTSVSHRGGEIHEGHGDGEEFSLGETLILQGIHTVEFVLGSISHTASYLRLWALSLAHQQLSEVLWTMVMRMSFGYSSYIGVGMVFVIFSAWAFLTISILVLMEGLSAFLHTLRLHWVEFQSKFYHGEGYPFIPFSFKTMLSQMEADSAE